MKSVKFGEAIEALNNFKIVRRSSWREGEFVFKQVPTEIPRSIVPKMTSLPDSVKEEFERRFNDPAEQVNSITYAYQLAHVNSSNLIIGYSPSVIDTLAEDWVIL